MTYYLLRNRLLRNRLLRPLMAADQAQAPHSSGRP